MPVDCFSSTLYGRVVAVADGDTLTVLDDSNKQHKIRITGIDAPEKRQAFGLRSKQNLAQIAFNKSVQVVWSKRDRYNRIIGKILVFHEDDYCQDGLCSRHQDVGLSQIESGLAWHYKKYQLEQAPEDRKSYSKKEDSARVHRLGLWSEESPMAPWDFRRNK